MRSPGVWLRGPRGFVLMAAILCAPPAVAQEIGEMLKKLDAVTGK
jgi:hypothetical protein